MIADQETRKKARPKSGRSRYKGKQIINAISQGVEEGVEAGLKPANF